MKLPPWFSGARKASKRGGPGAEKAVREVRRWERMKGYAEAIAEALDGSEVLEVVNHGLTATGLDRLAVGQVRLADGQTVVLPDARPLREDWLADPSRAGGKVGGCANAWGVRPHRDGVWKAGPVSCGCGLCPLCTTTAVAVRRDEWTHELEQLVSHGYHVVLLTRTRPADVAPESPVPVVWTAADTARWGPCPWPTADECGPDERAGLAVPGETLGQAWDALAASWRRVLDSRRAVLWLGQAIPRREWWARTVVCQLDAVEGTQVVTGQDGRATGLRWHVHGHSVVVLDPQAIVPARDTFTDDAGRVVLRADCPWMRCYLAAWSRESEGSRDAAQHAALVSVGGPEAIRNALHEVIKYAGKLSEMSTAGIVEWLATTKGRRPHRAGGTLHGATRRGRVARAGRLLDRLRDLEALGELDAEAARAELWEALTDDGKPDSLTPEAHVEQLAETLDGWERTHAAHVREAMTSFDRADRRERALHGWQGDVYDVPEVRIGDEGREGQRHLLTWQRLGELLAAGIVQRDGLTLVRGPGQVEQLGLVDLRAVRREVGSWQARARGRGRD